ATDFSVRAEVAPPLPGVPIALQLAEADLFAGGGEDATGFALRWDGERWRLQYWRAGTLEADLPLAAVPAAASLEGEWLLVELALEPRSAAAWVWRRDEPQPAQPSAVFAPPEAAAQDGARPRFLFLPAHLVANVILEGATRDAW
ncbi:MAG: hypothetical protein ACRDJN_30585, partial [Chloroflexota bacterium]